MSKSKTMSYKNELPPNEGFLDRFSPLKFEKFPATSVKKKSNCFRSYQPRKGEVLDYNISETFLQMEHVGTQIKYRETIAEYVPAPEKYKKKLEMKKKKIVYSHGGPPQGKFVDETWLQRQEELQKIFKKEFKKFVKRRRNRDKCINDYHHSVIQRLCGPEWYQELSPKQIKTVNTLQDCIANDLKNSTFCLTKDAIAQLGLVCRPHHKKIELALRYSCGCPVEFLFILYQMLEPKRKKYSLNDRLLLSAVVHLTMAHTLRELHVRIPSPVENTKSGAISAKKKPKTKTYASPYLVPYTFKPDPAKHTGIYRKKHIQHPECPYFSYLDFFRVEKRIAQNCSEFSLKDLEENEQELVEETIQAQKTFNEIHRSENVILIKPTIWKSCNEYESYKEKKQEKSLKKLLPPLQNLELSLNECICPSEIETDPEETIKETISCEKCNNRIQKPTISSFCDECRHKKINVMITGITVIGCNTILPIHGGIYFDATCFCDQKLEHQLIFLKTKKNLERTNPKYVINGVVITSSGPVFCLSSAIWNNRLKKLLKTVSKSQHQKEKLSENELKEADRFKDQSSATDDFCSCQNESRDETTKIFSSSGPTPPEDCQCKRALDSFLNNKCTCEGCNIEKRRKNATYILTGTTEFENEPSSKIIQGLQDYQCNCLENYLEKMERVEEYRKRCQVAYELRKKRIKYALSGVTYTDEGPIYQISGLRPPIQCICGQLLEEEAQLREELRRQPKMSPTGRIKYGISGIKETSEENFYIITQALESDKCDCEQLYEEFMMEHGNCWEAYQHFLERKDIEKTEYIKEQSVSEGNEVSEMVSDDRSDCYQHDIAASNQQCCKVLGNNEPYSRECVSENQIRRQSEKQCEFKPQLPNNFGQGKMNAIEEDASCQCRKNGVPKQNDGLKSSKKIQKKECQCECKRSDSLSFDPNYTIKLNPSAASLPRKEEQCFFIDEPIESKKKIKRFIFLKEFPKSFPAQMMIVKEALATMAADGFPLAKLPDSYKLPQFKLWMELRMGKIWTQDDRKYYAYCSKMYWGHSDICYHPVPIPKVNFSKEVLKKLTWSSANRCRDILEHQKYVFRRQIKQQIVDKAREFFPTVFAYEFPSKTFRKCYFAYLPDKEESEIVHRTIY